MAYLKEYAIAAQNAGSTAATLYASLVAAGQVTGFQPETYNEIRKAVFNGTLNLAGAETIVEGLESPPTERFPSDAPAGTPGRQNPANVVINFGRHRNKTIGDVDVEDHDYIEWLAESSNNDFIKRVAREFLGK